MRALIVTLAGALLLASAAYAQDEPVPQACRPDAGGRVDHQACADAAQPGSTVRSLALINLGTQAFLQQNYADAVRLYDEARPPGGLKMYSDASFHAFRGAAYDRVGRTSEAAEDARLALAFLRGAPPAGLERAPPVQDPGGLYALILPVLKHARDPEYAAALAAYRAIPSADWVAYANRAGVLTEVEDFPGAEAAMRESLRLAPDEPSVLNNACYLLTKMGRAGEGVAHCVRAVEKAPQAAAVHDTYADALAALGRCREAQVELAAARRLDPASKVYQRNLACSGR